MSNQQPEIKPVKIGNRFIGPGHPVYIVAEISANHGQDYDEAVRLIRAAKDTGADAVKLQTYTPDTMTIDCDDEPFRHGNGSLWAGQTLYQLYKKAYMPWEWQPKLQTVAHDLGMDFFSSAYDTTSVDFLNNIDVPAIKISSFEIVDLPLIEYAASTGRPLIISTGMAVLDEIEAAVAAASRSGCTDLVLLKCTSAYPTAADEMNLKTIPHMAGYFSLPCGLSDHSFGSGCTIAAVALGAIMIERHLTLSRKNGSVDSGFSTEPAEFKVMVEEIRSIEKALGNVSYGVTPSEAQSHKFRRSLFVVKDVKKDGLLNHQKIQSIRPGQGLPPKDIGRVIGRKAKKTLKKGRPLSWDVIDA